MKTITGKLTVILMLFAAIPFARCQQLIELRNKSLQRTFEVRDGHFYTIGQRLLRAQKEFHYGKICREFSFRLDTGTCTTADFHYVNHSLEKTDPTTQHLTVTLAGTKKTAGIDVELHYWLYDTLSVVRKKIHIKNRTGSVVVLTDLNTEDIPIDVSYTSWSEIYANFGTSLERMPFKGNYNDAALLIINPDLKTGVILGNEALSVMKRTEIYTTGFPRVQIGLAASKDTYPFKKYLPAGETFVSPGSFLCFFKTDSWQNAFEQDFADFTRSYLGIRLNGHPSPPLLIYNTWKPFRTDITADIVHQSIDGLAGTGTDLFIVDCGWYDKMGDYRSDSVKFKDGIVPIFDHIRQAGMKGGLWFSFATANVQSDVVKQHPEWVLRDSGGNPMLVHDISRNILSERAYTMSMASPWYDHIRKKISHYIRTCKLSYVKLDLAAAIGSYQPDPAFSGDYDTGGGKLYRDHASSYWEIFEKTLEFCDDLHREFPDLLIDYTYETHGRHNGVDYALLQHAEYDWITNYELKAPEGPVSIRQLRYERARTMPISTLLIGNQLMEEATPEMTEFTYLSLVSATGILVGDVRKMPASTKTWYNTWNRWFREMNDRFQFTRYYQSGEIFDHPTSQNWDGCYRFNTQKEGGVLFFYRNASPDTSRTFRVHCVKPNSTYRVYNAKTRKQMGLFMGSDLMKKGIKITLPNEYTAAVLGIERI